MLDPIIIRFTVGKNSELLVQNQSFGQLFRGYFE